MRQTITLILFMVLVSCSTKEYKTKQSNSRIIDIMMDKIPQNKEKILELLSKDSQSVDDILLFAPMSGVNSSIGDGIIKASILAAEEETNKKIIFHIIDSSSQSLEGFKLQDNYKKIKAIIGPVFFSEAKQLGVLFPDIPILTLSNNLSLNDKHVFACGLSPKDEIHSIIKFTKKNHINNFLVLLPNDKFGEQICIYIQEEFEKNHMSEMDDFEIIRYSKFATQNITQIANASKRKSIFIIEPILNTEKIKKAKIFTLSSCALSNMKKMNNVIFAFAYDQKQDQFIQRFQKAFGSIPTVLDMISYDLVKAIYKTTAENVEVENYSHNGCCGEFLIKPNHGLKRKYKIFQLKNGNKKEI